MPCLEKMLSRFGITVLAEVDVMISTSGKRLYSCVTTSNMSPDGSGPAKSTDTTHHGAGGRLDILSGSGCVDFLVVVWHDMH